MPGVVPWGLGPWGLVCAAEFSTLSDRRCHCIHNLAKLISNVSKKNLNCTNTERHISKAALLLSAGQRTLFCTF